MEPVQSGIQVFISRNSDDAPLAKELFDFLTSEGLKVFDSGEMLHRMGNTDYLEQIDKVLDECSHMIVMGSSIKNISSNWVKKEWTSFVNEKLAGRKQGNLLTVITSDVEIIELPLTLRNYMVINYDSQHFDRIIAYLQLDLKQTLNKFHGTEKNKSAHLSNSNYGKAQFAQQFRHNLRHICTIFPGDKAVPNSKQKPGGLESITYSSDGEFLLTFSRDTNQAKIWRSSDGEMCHQIKVDGTLKGAFFTHELEIVAYTADTIFEFTNKVNNSKEWSLKSATKIQNFGNLKSPVICEVVANASLKPVIKAILVKEENYEDENYIGPSMFLIESWDKNGVKFYTWLRVKANIHHIKPVGNTFVAFTSEDVIYKVSETWYSLGITGLILLNTDTINEVLCLWQYYQTGRLADMGKMNDELTEILRLKKIRAFYTGAFTVVEGGYTCSVGYESRNLIALAGNTLTIMTPMKDILQTFRGHAEPVVKMSWGGFLGNGSYKVSQGFMQLLVPSLRKPENYCKAFLATASREGTIKIWHAEKGKEVARFENISPLKPVFTWARKNYFAYADIDGFVHTFEIIYKF